MRDRLDEDMRAAGASMPQWIVLKTVGDEPELSQRELADRVLVTGSTLTHHLDRLEADGYITPHAATPSDRRVAARRADAGRQAAPQPSSTPSSAATTATSKSLLTAREAATLNRLLRHAASSASTTKEAPMDRTTTAATRRRPPARRPIVRTRALSKTYPGDMQAVIELDMEIRAGEIYGFLGPNGAGKSTTIGMLTTRVTPTERRGRGRRRRHHPPPGAGQAGHRRRAADEHARPGDDRRREPLLPRPLLRHERASRPRRPPTSCSSRCASPTGPTRR